MVIYGVGLLAFRLFFCKFIGELLGAVTGINSDVGGVGFAMLILILASDWAEKNGMFSKKAGDGILFWSAMYIPIVVAMSMIQNVLGALTGGVVAFLAGVISVVVMFALVRPIAKLAGKADNTWASNAQPLN